MKDAKYLNPEQTYGTYIDNRGIRRWGPIPPEAGDQRAAFDAWIEGGGVVEPYQPPEEATYQSSS